MLLCVDHNITHVADCLLDIALVIDCSGSIRDSNPPNVDNWVLIVNFLVRLVESINVGEQETHVGAVSFGTQLKRCLFCPCCVPIISPSFYLLNNSKITDFILLTFDA